MKTGERLIGKKVQLYPHDTYKKTARVIDETDHGFIFSIIYADKKADYKPGETIFISHSKPLSFKIINEE